MTRTRFRKLYFFSYSLQRTSHDFEKDNPRGNESVTTQLGSESASALSTKPLPYPQNCQPAPVVSRQEQQEATTHHGSEFENQIF